MTQIYGPAHIVVLDSRRVSSCITRFGACTAFTLVTAYKLAKSPKRPSTPEASAASLPPLLLRLLPGGANQIPGGILTRCEPAPFHGARETQVSNYGRPGSRTVTEGSRANAKSDPFQRAWQGGPPRACGSWRPASSPRRNLTGVDHDFGAPRAEAAALTYLHASAAVYGAERVGAIHEWPGASRRSFRVPAMSG